MRPSATVKSFRIEHGRGAQSLPGFLDAIVGRLGASEPEELASRIASAVIERQERVFCREATVRAAYEDRLEIRRGIAADALKAAAPGVGLPEEMIDTFVIGGDDPLVVGARDQWERERSARK